MTSSTQSELQNAFDASIWYLITLWPPMALALSNSFGGPLTSDKRDWLAGTLSDLFVTRPQTDAYDIEDVLLQVMGDEFDLEVQDESEAGVAADIMRLKKELFDEGRMDGALEVRARWERLKGHKIKMHDGGEKVEEVGSDEDIEVDGDGDEEMDDVESAPALLDVSRTKNKPEPEVDEDGFTTVVSKRKR